LTGHSDRRTGTEQKNVRDWSVFGHQKESLCQAYHQKGKKRKNIMGPLKVKQPSTNSGASPREGMDTASLSDSWWVCASSAYLHTGEVRQQRRWLLRRLAFTPKNLPLGSWGKNKEGHNGGGYSYVGRKTFVKEKGLQCFWGSPRPDKGHEKGSRKVLTREASTKLTREA